MYLTKTQKELISRVTMAILALALFAAATVLVIAMVRVSGFGLGRLLIPVIVVLYVIALVLGCFVVTPLDSRRSNVGRTMTIGDKLSNGISILFEVLWGWWW